MGHSTPGGRAVEGAHTGHLQRVPIAPVVLDVRPWHILGPVDQERAQRPTRAYGRWHRARRLDTAACRLIPLYAFIKRPARPSSGRHILEVLGARMKSPIEQLVMRVRAQPQDERLAGTGQERRVKFAHLWGREGGAVVSTCMLGRENQERRMKFAHRLRGDPVKELERHAIGDPLGQAFLPGEGPALLLSEADRSEDRRGGSPGQCSGWRGSSCGPRIRWQRAIAQGRTAAIGSARGDWRHRDLRHHEPLILSCLVVCSFECLGAGGVVATVDVVASSHLGRRREHSHSRRGGRRDGRRRPRDVLLALRPAQARRLGGRLGRQCCKNSRRHCRRRRV